jgi:hypothetical protein
MDSLDLNLAYLLSLMKKTRPGSSYGRELQVHHIDEDDSEVVEASHHLWHYGNRSCLGLDHTSSNLGSWASYSACGRGPLTTKMGKTPLIKALRGEATGTRSSTKDPDIEINPTPSSIF